MPMRVLLPKDVVEALEEFRKTYIEGHAWMVIAAIVRDTEKISHYESIIKSYAKLSEKNFLKIMDALVNGYEVEETPEDKVRAMYQETINNADDLHDHPQAEWWRSRRKAIVEILDILNIKIEGVNA